jgi:hypothetical protein
MGHSRFLHSSEAIDRLVAVAFYALSTVTAVRRVLGRYLRSFASMYSRVRLLFRPILPQPDDRRFEHVVTCDCGSNFDFDGCSEAFLAKAFPRVLPKVKGWVLMADTANRRRHQ